MDHKYSSVRLTAVVDTECFKNYWSIGFRPVDRSRAPFILEFYKDHPLDKQRVATIMRNWRTVGFNSWDYDINMILLAMKDGVTNDDLKRASDDIIVGKMLPWIFRERHGLVLPSFIDHIDVQNVNPGSPQFPSLKVMAGRLHSKEMRDLPFTPDAWINETDRPIMRDYLEVDLEDTIDLYQELKQQVELRAQLSDEFGVDVRSKSDAQVAEAIVKTEIEKTGPKVYKPKIEPGSFNYVAPEWVKFETPQMRELLRLITSTPFDVGLDGYIKARPTLADALDDIVIGLGHYKAGIGGLHSKEARQSVYSDDEYILLDRDVTSYYPSIILGAGIYPKHLGKAFLTVYRRIYERRVKAKADGNKPGLVESLSIQLKNIAETLKIVLNGVFGKLGNPHSIFYSPPLMLQTTLNGQLALLMFIERVTALGFRVVSANTDGVVTLVPRERRGDFMACVFDWEIDTGFVTEETEYRSLHSRSVNDYVAFPFKGKPKGKGGFGGSGPGLKGAMGMKKNPDMDIAFDAVMEFIGKGTPVNDTIRACRDLKKLVSVTRVQKTPKSAGGAYKDGEYIGKAIRWYYGANEKGCIETAEGNKVPNSQGAVLCLHWPEEFPEDIDWFRYEREAQALLQDLGLPSTDPAFIGATHDIVARPEDQKTWHIVMPNATAHCGKTNKSIRDEWIIASDVPTGERICKKCVQASAGRTLL